MKLDRIYCGARDQDVRVVITDEPPHDAQATLPDSECICLELAQSCTGAMCPICSAPPSAMLAKLVHQGLPTDGVLTVRGFCPDCGFVTDFAPFRDGHVVCLDCGTRRTDVLAG